MTRFLRRLLLLVLLGASVSAAVRALRGRKAAIAGANDAPSWPAVIAAESPVAAPTDPTVPHPVAGLQPDADAPGPARAADTDGAQWVAPVDGTCPAGFPVKANQSGIYHVRGGQFYDRTTPERCYATPGSAEADGYRAARR